MPAKQAAALEKALAETDPEALARALGAEAAGRIGRFLAGIEGYRAHPYRRRLEDPPVLWQAGTTRVLAFGGEASGAPVLLVPSLINRAYILDLTAQRSFARYLRERGLRPYLLDWEAPGADERDFGLDDYILGRLEPALEAVHHDAGRPVTLAGYCMGGTMVLPLAARADVAALVLLATPWDFWADGRHQERLIAAHLPGLTALIESLEQMPPDALQAMFAALDPLLAARKFTRLCRAPARLRRGAELRRAGRLAQRCRAAHGPRGSGLPGRLVRRERARGWVLAGGGRGGSARAYSCACAQCCAGAGSHRPPRLVGGLERRVASCGDLATAARSYRDDGEPANQAPALAPACGVDRRPRRRVAPILRANA